MKAVAALRRCATGVAARYRRWFPERQILFRQNDRISAVRLSPRFQASIAAMLVAVALWSLVSTAGFLLTQTEVADARAEVERTRVAYHELIDEVAGQHRKVLGITRDLEHYRAYLLALLEQNEALQVDLRSFASQLETAEAEKERVSATEGVLRGELKELEQELAWVTERHDVLQTDVGSMKNRLAVSEDERQRFAQLRSALDRRLVKLEQDLSGTQVRALDLEKSVAQRQSALDLALSKQRQAVQEREQMAQRVADVEARMAAMSQAHEESLNKLTQQTRSSIEEVERIVNATGIDFKRLVPSKPATSARQGRGGPFVPWGAERQKEIETVPALTGALTGDIERLDQLRQLLRALPLAQPVGSYTLGSNFGFRIDPFNGKAAYHEGMDMLAPTGTRIVAPSAGRVVFAGWHSTYGRLVEIDHGYGLKTRYAHMSKISVDLGERVSARQEIGLVGNSGRSSGSHLHYEVLVNGRPQNPSTFLKAASHVLTNR